MEKTSEKINKTRARQIGRREFLRAVLFFLGGSLLTAEAGCQGNTAATGPAGSSTARPGATTVTATVTSTATPPPSTTTITRPPVTTTVSAIGSSRPTGWSALSHGNKAEPNYEVVFPQDKVNRMKITIAPDDWAAMQADMRDLFGSRPTAGQLPPPPGGQAPGMANPVAATAPAGGARQALAEPGIPGGGGSDMTPTNPMWVPATIEFNGLTWTYVGVRYKGNSSLRSGWTSGVLKLPLKLDFDEFETEHPEIDNQRFFGFKQLSLSNAFSDNTYMRDALAYDIFEEAGLPASQTAFYEIILDYGQGEQNLGIYVAIEVTDDTVVNRYFGDDSGNIYEGDGRGATLAAGATLASIESSFQKENNPGSDWSDIQGLYDVLHDVTSATDPAAWRAKLEEVFDVDTFLEWLAISAVIQNWDNYGFMTHNFYLYHDPDTDRLFWISWDHNNVLRGGGGGTRYNTTLDKKDVGVKWPLIRFLMDEPAYYQRYIGFVAETIAGPFTVEKMTLKCEHYAALLAPYMSQTTFSTSVQQLLKTIDQRVQATRGFLSTQ